MHFFDISTSKSGPTLVCFVHFDFEMCFAPQRRALFQHPNLQKWREHVVFLSILTSKCASRHNGVHFFNIRTSTSGANMWCFVHFDFEMCFAPQRRALFRHRNFQKWSGPGVFLYILTWKCASRHNGVHFFDISTAKSGPDLVCFVHFDLECASRHNGVHFFDVTTSKSGPNLVCFAHFDLEMCFAPQRRALFHLSSGQLAPHLPL